MLARTVPHMIALSLIIAAGSALLGFWVAYIGDLATSSTMAVVDALLLIAVLCLTRLRRRPAGHAAGADTPAS